jgi:hypothetical protein
MMTLAGCGTRLAVTRISWLLVWLKPEVEQRAKLATNSDKGKDFIVKILDEKVFMRERQDSSG